MKTKRLIAVMGMLMLGAGVRAENPAEGVISKPLFGKPVPEVSAVDLQGNAVTLAAFKGKPVVLQFGSLSEPVVRLHEKDVEKLATQLNGKVVFLFVYQKESHPAGSEDSLKLNSDDGVTVAAPANEDGRLKLALQMIDTLGIKKQQVVLDEFGNGTSARYGGLPNMTFLIDEKGNLAAAYPWMDAVKLRLAINNVLAGKPVADANMGPARTEQQPITIPDGLGNQGPGAGVVSAAVILDGMTLSDQQRVAVIKPLTAYVAALRNLKEKADKAAIAAGGATQPAAMAANRAEELKKVAETAKELKAALKANLKAEDNQKMVEALSQGAGKALFVGGN